MYSYLIEHSKSQNNQRDSGGVSIRERHAYRQPQTIELHKVNKRFIMARIHKMVKIVKTAYKQNIRWLLISLK